MKELQLDTRLSDSPVLGKTERLPGRCADLTATQNVRVVTNGNTWGHRATELQSSQYFLKNIFGVWILMKF